MRRSNSASFGAHASSSFARGECSSAISASTWCTSEEAAAAAAAGGEDSCASALDDAKAAVEEEAAAAAGGGDGDSTVAVLACVSVSILIALAPVAANKLARRGVVNSSLSSDRSMNVRQCDIGAGGEGKGGKSGGCQRIGSDRIGSDRIGSVR